MSLKPGQAKNWFFDEMSSMSRNLLSHHKPSIFNAILIGRRTLVLNFMNAWALLQVNYRYFKVLFLSNKAKQTKPIRNVKRISTVR